MKKYCFRLHIC